jgi:S-adenosylmethionine:tRNA ribosyltransferase-isomerase
VVNDSKVLAARLFGQKPTGGRVEILLVEPIDAPGLRWRAMAQASKAIRPGQSIELAPGVVVQVVEDEREGFFVLDLPEPGEELARRFGQLPLPPYLGRGAEPIDQERYQTIFAVEQQARSVAAPTAGLHFTKHLLGRLEARGIGRSELTLHVGPGTFLPVRHETIELHRMHKERWAVGEASAVRIARAKSEGRVVAVGTTSVRVLETLGLPVRAGEGATDLFIRPGFEFEVVDAMVTNFHLPRSTLLMLVAAFAGRETILAAYAEAVREGYRFFSYGDAMVIT